VTLSKKPSAVNPRPSATNKRPSAVNARPSNAGLSRHPDSGAGPVAPAIPTLTAPTNNANVFNSIAVTVSATTTDTNLDQMDWLLDGVTVVATVVGVGTPAGTYSTTWTPTGVTDGAHTLTARATRSAQAATSAGITVNMGEVLHTLVTSVTCLRAWQSDFQVHDAGGLLCDSWTDQKSAVAALQGTGGNQPAIVANAVGTRTAIRTDGSNDFLRDATLDLNAPATVPTFIWAVLTQRTWVASKTPLSSGTTLATTSLTTPGAGASPQLVAFNAGAVPPVNSGAVLLTPTRVEAYYHNTTGDYLKLGSVVTTGTALGNSNPAAGFNMGAVSTGAQAAACDFYAVLVFSGLPSGAELSALSAAAAAMYPGVAV
jgi:hypothetical protein